MCPQCENDCTCGGQCPECSGGGCICGGIHGGDIHGLGVGVGGGGQGDRARGGGGSMCANFSVLIVVLFLIIDMEMLI